MNNITSFLVKSVILYIIWQGLSIVWIQQPDGPNEQLVTLTGQVIEFILTKAGYHSSCQWGTLPPDENLYVAMSKKALIISLNGTDAVALAPGCSGLELMALFLGFIIAYPGKALYKIVFGCIGIFGIFITNIARVIALAINITFSYESFEINHQYSYNFVMYGLVFLLWMWWVNKYSTVAKPLTN